MIKLPFKKPNTDFDELVKVLNGETLPKSVYLVELGIDEEIIKYIIESFFGEEYHYSPLTSRGKESIKETLNRIGSKENIKLSKKYYKQTANFYHLMGYSYLPYFEYDHCFRQIFFSQEISSKDTASLSRGQRDWAQEGYGLISSWKDFEDFPWDAARDVLPYIEDQLNYISKILPDGMKVVPSMAMFEEVLEYFLGYEGLFLGLHDNPKLVKAILDKVGELVLNYYNAVIPLESVGAIFHTDDLGFKTSTMISINNLRDLVFPWFKKFILASHEHKKPIWLHSCGYKDDIILDIIGDLKFDAIHSFEDSCCPVTRYKEKYGGGNSYTWWCRYG